MVNGTDTAKAALMVKGIGPGMSAKNFTGALNNTVRIKQGDATFSVDFTDRTLYPASSLASCKDVVAKLDYKVQDDITAHSEFNAATKKVTLGATWAPKGVTDGLTACKLTYSNADNLIRGNAAFSLAKNQKAAVAFDQNKMLVAKYTVIHEDMLFEPSYNFPKGTWAVGAEKKLNKNKVRLNYDLGIHAFSAELTHAPFKATLSSNLTGMKPLKAALPTLSIACEKVFQF